MQLPIKWQDGMIRNRVLEAISRDDFPKCFERPHDWCPGETDEAGSRQHPAHRLRETSGLRPMSFVDEDENIGAVSGQNVTVGCRAKLLNHRSNGPHLRIAQQAAQFAPRSGLPAIDTRGPQISMDL